MSAMVLVEISLVWYVSVIVLIICELGQRMTDAFEEIDDVIGKFQWYSFPDALKRLMPFMIQFAQQPVDIEFFGSISCSRDTFEKVS